MLGVDSESSLDRHCDLGIMISTSKGCCNKMEEQQTYYYYLLFLPIT
jgi:hypothetical protein